MIVKGGKGVVVRATKDGAKSVVAAKSQTMMILNNNMSEEQLIKSPIQFYEELPKPVVDCILERLGCKSFVILGLDTPIPCEDAKMNKPCSGHFMSIFGWQMDQKYVAQVLKLALMGLFR